jgi:hypothetical protein
MMNLVKSIWKAEGVAQVVDFPNNNWEFLELL